MTDASGLIERVCAERELPCERTGTASWAVTLPGTHKLKTVCNLVLGEHALRIEAFVMRRPDERHEELWAWMLRHNARMYGVSFSIDAAGDIYLTGRVGLGGLDEDELDRLLGSVLTYADESFDSLLEIGFGTAIRREWEWRAKRGESLANLRAFAHFADPDRTAGPGPAAPAAGPGPAPEKNAGSDTSGKSAGSAASEKSGGSDTENGAPSR